MSGLGDDDGADVRPAREPSPAGDDLRGLRFVVSAGPTAEPLTRFGDVVSNFSSGLQGWEVACALADRGAAVRLVAGPTPLADPAHPGIETVRVSTAREMLDAVLASLPADCYVGVAAVADFAPAVPSFVAWRPDLTATLTLEQNPDILQTVGTHPTLRPRAVIGFAAETRDLEAYARGKLERKGADAIFGNLVGEAATARGSGRNHVLLVTADGAADMGETDKYAVGVMVGDFVRARVAR
jgi:phosphopantothenoylcysteine decarboxylase/phosphopantothenate--cysteine ligase